MIYLVLEIESPKRSHPLTHAQWRNMNSPAEGQLKGTPQSSSGQQNRTRCRGLCPQALRSACQGVQAEKATYCLIWSQCFTQKLSDRHGPTHQCCPLLPSYFCECNFNEQMPAETSWRPPLRPAERLLHSLRNESRRVVRPLVALLRSLL